MSYAQLDPTDAHAKLSEFRIIDVRESLEIRGPLGHIEGIEAIPLGAIAAQTDSLEESPPLLLVCRSGKRSANACELLLQRGITDVTNLTGGMIAWNRAQLPTRREFPESLDALVRSVQAWLAQVSGRSLEDVVANVADLLEQAGASHVAPTVHAVEEALESIAKNLEESGPPPDLDLSISAFRSDLAVL
jgi:rhodanese-related sulfurtransferase